MCFCWHMSTNTNETIDLRNLFAAEWTASTELQQKLQTPLQGRDATVVNLNDWIAQKTRKEFARGFSSPVAALTDSHRRS